MNNIPAHLKGKSATEILQQMQTTHRALGNREYIIFLEMNLLIALKDALCTLTDREMGVKSGLAGEGRAIAFLNTICPPRKEEP